MRARLHFLVVTALVVAGLVGFVVVSYHYNWPWTAWVPGSHLFRPVAATLWDWLQAHLLIVLAVFLLGLVVARLTGRPGSGPGRRIKHVRKRAYAARSLGHPRSPEWPRVEQEHRLREPACVACGYKGRDLQVHHIKPFHLHPHLELEPDNLITLCQARGREHHLLLGHLDEWGSYNEHVRYDAKHFYRKSAAHIRADLHWQKKVMLRP